MQSKKFMSEIMKSNFDKINVYTFKNHTLSIKKVMFTVTLLAIACILLSIYGCSSQDDTPLGSLQSDKKSQKFDFNFWLNESKNKTDLWSQAEKYCDQAGNASNINCKNVVQISVFMNMNTEWPKYNANNEGFGKIPNSSH